MKLLAITETSDAAVVTVSSDLTPPTVVSAGALQGDNQVGVMFSELVNATSAQTAANYQVSGATVSSVVLHMGRVAQLNLAGGVPANFTVTVNNVTDLAGNAMASTQVTGEISTMIAVDVGVPAPIRSCRARPLPLAVAGPASPAVARTSGMPPTVSIMSTGNSRGHSICAPMS